MIESVLEPLFHKTSIKKHWTFAEVGTNFEIHENNISFESLNYYLSICDSDKLVFGRCSSARLAVELMNVNIELTGRNFDVNFTFENEPEVPFVVGNFTVTEDKPSPDRKTRSVTMYDALYFVLNTNYADWYNSISDNDWESMTLGDLADSFFAYVGITVESASRALLVNADMPVSKTLATEQLLGSDILFAICQAAGCFGVMTNNNEFRFLYLKSEIEGLFPANDLYPAEDLYPIEPVTTYIPNSEYYPPLVYETFMTPSITKLRIAESTNDVGTVVGSGDAGYEIIGNFLFFGKSAADLNTYGANTLGAMTQRNYRPFSVEKVGNLCFEIGDPIRLGNDDMAVESYILTRTFKGVQAFTDEISAAGTQDYTVVASSISTTVDKLQSKTLVIEKSVDGLSSRLTYELDDTIQGSYAYQTAQEIGSKVETTTFNNALNPSVQGSYAWQTAQAIGAKVDETHGDQTTGFSWELTSSSHTWYKDNTEVMKIDGTGLSVKGSITAGSTITGATITASDIISSDNSGNTVEINNGRIDCYVGTNAIHIAPRDIYFLYNNNYSGHIQAYEDANNTKVLFMGISGKLDLNGSSGVTIRGGELNLTGVSAIDIGSNAIWASSFRQLQFISSYTSTTINMQDDILTPISNIGSTAISAVEGAGRLSFILNSFAQMSFYSSYTSRTVTLNDIISQLSSLDSRVTALENA